MRKDLRSRTRRMPIEPVATQPLAFMLRYVRRHALAHVRDPGLGGARGRCADRLAIRASSTWSTC